MEVIQDKITHLYDGYLYYVSQSDTRVKDWLLMDAYWPTLALTALYLFVVYAGQRVMAHREPFKFHYTLTVYNLALVALNFHIFYELLTASWSLNYSYSCQLVSYTDDPNEMRIAKALWWYYFSKLVEFLDTIFFVLRKKNNQISFLHVYHHATMFPIWWIGIKWVAGGQSFFGAMINSFIHVLMYTYYGVAALGPEFQKYLWWKRYLTRLQLIQFIIGMFHAAQSLYIGCQFPLWMQYALIVYGTTILLLFLNFYFHAYINPSKSKGKKSAANGTVANGLPAENGSSKTRQKENKKKK